MDNNLILPPLNYDPAVVDSPLGAVGGVTSRQAIEAEVDEQLKLFDWQRYRQLQRAKETHEPIYSPQVDAYTGELEVLGYRKLPRKLLPAEEANRRYGMPQSGLTFNEPITEEAAAIIRKRKEAENYNQQILSEASGWTTAKAYGMGILASLVQPEQIAVNVVSSLIAAPIYGLRYTPQALEAMTVGRRLATRAKIGAVEGLVGSVVAEPIQTHFAAEERADYDLSNTLTNLVAGTTLGAGLHVVAGTGADWINGLSSRTWQESLGAAVKQLAEGKNVEVTPIVHNDPSVIARNTPTDNILLTPSKNPPTPEVSEPDNASLVAAIKQSIADMPAEVTTPDEITTLKTVLDSGHVEYQIHSDGVTINGKKYKVDTTPLFGEKVEATPDNVATTREATKPENMLVTKKFIDTRAQLVLSFGDNFIFTGDVNNWIPPGLVEKHHSQYDGIDLLALARDVAEHILKTKGMMVEFKQAREVRPEKTEYNINSPYYERPFLLVGNVIGGFPTDAHVVSKNTLIHNLVNDPLIQSGFKKHATLTQQLTEGISLAVDSIGKKSTGDSFLDKSRLITKLDDDMIAALAGSGISNNEPTRFNQDIRNFSDFQKVEGTEGLSSSNAGAVYIDKATGVHYFIKKNKTNMHSVNEYIANRFYQVLGVPVAKNILVKNGEDILLGSRIVDAMEYEAPTTLTLNQLKMLVGYDGVHIPDKEFVDAWVVDAWLANWDALMPGNVVLDEAGMPVRIDQGGALLFRAQGAAKGMDFRPHVNEFETIPANNDPLAKYLEKHGKVRPEYDYVSTADYKKALGKYLSGNEYAKRIAQLTPGDIQTIAAEISLGEPIMMKEIVSKLIARQADFVALMHSSDTLRTGFIPFGKKIFAKNKNALNWLEEKASKLFDSYTGDERTAISDYQGNSGGLNSFLCMTAKQGGYSGFLSNKPADSIPIQWGWHIEKLDSAVEKWKTPAPMQVYRWVSSSWYGLKTKNIRELIGAKYWDPGYASTSLFKANAFSDRDMLLTINLPEGQKAIIADAARMSGKSSFSGEEAEIILPRDMHYYIRSAEYVDGKYHITMDALPDKIAGMNVHEAVIKAMKWQEEQSLAAQGVQPISPEEVKQMLDALAMKKGPVPMLTDKVLTQQEKDIMELIGTLEQKLTIEFPDNLTELTSIIKQSDEDIASANAYATAMIKAAACYTGR